jgi:MSHA pilin protein MshC
MNHRKRETPDANDAMAGEQGFTIVELVVVIVIVGVLSAIALPKFFDNRTFAERAYFEEVAASLKLAQKLAVGTGCPVRMTIAASGYEARQQAVAGTRCASGDTTWTVEVQTTDGGVLAGTPPSGVSAGPSFTVVFDSLGATNLAANQTVTVGTHSLTLQAASGYVEVN